MKTILFVDDEPKVLEGLRRMLRGLRNEWHMTFVSGGQEALEYLARSPWDVVVTDMRMPGIDGGQLLKEVRRRWPATVRIVLSGQCDRESVLKSVGPTHQFLTKPCDSQMLKATVARACALRDRLSDPHLRRLASRLEAIPSHPLCYGELTAELEAASPSMARVGAAVTCDAGASARVLQLVNSGFFGTPRRVSEAACAINLLGLETLRALVRDDHIIAPYDLSHPLAPALEAFHEHALAVARAAQRIAAAETDDPTVRSDAFLAGLLHDVGLLVLAHDSPDRYRDLLARAQQARASLWETEQELVHATHADVGAYLIALWGLPDPVVEAIAHHHQPSRCADSGFCPLTAVHVANALLEEDILQFVGLSTAVEIDYLERIGLADRLNAWKGICLAGRPEGACA